MFELLKGGEEEERESRWRRRKGLESGAWLFLFYNVSFLAWYWLSLFVTAFIQLFSVMSFSTTLLALHALYPPLCYYRLGLLNGIFEDLGNSCCLLMLVLVLVMDEVGVCLYIDFSMILNQLF
ncbi:hypothetical protein ACQKWADRAFT_35986 [Trichoderma austrokoningii]